MSQTEIADGIGADDSTISQELVRYAGQWRYSYQQSHRVVLKRRKEKIDGRINENDWDRIHKSIKQN